MVGAVIGAIAKVGGFGLLGLGASALLSKPKAATPVQQLPGPTRDDAKAAQNLNDEMLRRKGGAADIITGVRGAEAPSSGGKTVLGA
jgi:hypothetical protein